MCVCVFVYAVNVLEGLKGHFLSLTFPLLMPFDAVVTPVVRSFGAAPGLNAFLVGICIHPTNQPRKNPNGFRFIHRWLRDPPTMVRNVVPFVGGASKGEKRGGGEGRHERVVAFAGVFDLCTCLPWESG